LKNVLTNAKQFQYKIARNLKFQLLELIKYMILKK